MSKYASKYSGKNADKFDSNYEKIQIIVEKFKASVSDGVQVKDAATWGDLVCDAYDIAKNLFGDQFNKEEMTDLVCYIYWCIDPEIPWVPEPIETSLERKFIEGVAIPWAVGAAWHAVERYIASKKS